MGKQAQNYVMKQVVLQRQLTISGGLSKKPHVLSTKSIDMGKTRKDCVLITPREGWLCEMATGQAAFSRPLARIRILNKMRSLCCDGEDVVDEKMDALAFDDEDFEDKKAKHSSHKCKGKQKNSSAMAENLKAKWIDVPNMPGNRQVKNQVAVAVDGKKRLWLDVDSVNWLVAYIAEEKENGSVEPIVEPIAESPNKSAVRWNFRDECWAARAKTPTGQVLTNTASIKRQAKNDGAARGTAKQRAYEEMMEWAMQVETGAICCMEV